MYTPFKMKGKSPMMKALIGNQGNLNAGLRASIEATPESPAKMAKKSPTKKINPFSAEYKRMTPRQKREAREKAGGLKGSGKKNITAANVKESLGNLDKKLKKGADNVSRVIKGKNKDGTSKGALVIKSTKNETTGKRSTTIKRANNTDKPTNDGSNNNNNSNNNSSNNGFSGMKGGDAKYTYKKNSDGSYTGKNSNNPGKTFTIKKGGKGYDNLEKSGLKMKKTSSMKMMKKSPAKLKKGGTTTSKTKKSTYVSDLKKGTVTETTPKGSKITRSSWPNVKPGTKSSFPGTSTDAMGKVSPFDPMKRQVLFNKK